MYLVTVGTQTHDYDTRAAAIAAAKEFSVEHRGTVLVHDEEERERFTYHRGKLESYTYDTRGGRKPGDRDRDRDRDRDPSD